jgi:hypothetical protein
MGGTDVVISVIGTAANPCTFSATTVSMSGGAFYTLNSGSNTVTITYGSFTTPTAATHGGIGYF